jgi:hypothetical protein
VRQGWHGRQVMGWARVGKCCAGVGMCWQVRQAWGWWTGVPGVAGVVGSAAVRRGEEVFACVCKCLQV